MYSLKYTAFNMLVLVLDYESLHSSSTLRHCAPLCLKFIACLFTVWQKKQLVMLLISVQRASSVHVCIMYTDSSHPYCVGELLIRG